MFVDSSSHSHARSAFDPRELRGAFGRFATGLTVVTASSEDGPVGITANSFSSVSLDPPLVLWSIARSSRRFEAFARSRAQAIHILGSSQLELCRRFFRDGRDFAGLDVSTDAGGVPLIEGALARLECDIVNRMECGDHLVLVAQIRAIQMSEGEPLVFAAGRYGTLAALAS